MNSVSQMFNYTPNINTHFNGVEHLYLAPPKNTEAIAAPSPAYGRIPPQYLRTFFLSE
jgi:hypothetical protein